MALDQSDVRSTLASYGASTRPTPTDFVSCEYVRFYDTEPQETTAGTRTWYARGQNFVLAYTGWNRVWSGRAPIILMSTPCSSPTATDRPLKSLLEMSPQTSRHTRSHLSHPATVASK